MMPGVEGGAPSQGTLSPPPRAHWGPPSRAHWGPLPGHTGAPLPGHTGAPLPGHTGGPLPEHNRHKGRIQAVRDALAHAVWPRGLHNQNCTDTTHTEACAPVFRFASAAPGSWTEPQEARSPISPINHLLSERCGLQGTVSASQGWSGFGPRQPGLLGPRGPTHLRSRFRDADLGGWGWTLDF